jgi:hypothetical protein
MTGPYQLNWWQNAHGWHVRMYGLPTRPAAPRTPGPFAHVWYWRELLPDRKGQPCRINACGRMNAVEVEFPDGAKVITSRYAVRKAIS